MEALPSGRPVPTCSSSSGTDHYDSFCYRDYVLSFTSPSTASLLPPLYSFPPPSPLQLPSSLPSIEPPSSLLYHLFPPLYGLPPLLYITSSLPSTSLLSISPPISPPPSLHNLPPLLYITSSLPSTASLFSSISPPPSP